MSSPASIKKHPLHPMLVAFPIGLWIFSLVADILRRVTDDEQWKAVALYTMGGGIVGALIAAIPGSVDLISMRDPRVKRIGIFHMLINLAAVGYSATTSSFAGRVRRETCPCCCRSPAC